MTQKLIILAIRYPEEKEKEVEELLDHQEMKLITAIINTNIGEVWKPYQGPLDKKIDGLIDDLTIFNVPEEKRELNKVVKAIQMERCFYIQKFLKEIKKDSIRSFAESVINHVNFCKNCQEFVSANFNVVGGRDLEFYINRKLAGEKFEKL